MIDTHQSVAVRNPLNTLASSIHSLGNGPALKEEVTAIVHSEAAQEAFNNMPEMMHLHCPQQQKFWLLSNSNGDEDAIMFDPY
jgi:hypothetical protein